MPTAFSAGLCSGVNVKRVDLTAYCAGPRATKFRPCIDIHQVPGSVSVLHPATTHYAYTSTNVRTIHAVRVDMQHATRLGIAKRRPAHHLWTLAAHQNVLRSRLPALTAWMYVDTGKASIRRGGASYRV